MNIRLKQLLSKQTLTTLSRINPRSLSSASSILPSFNGGNTPSRAPFHPSSNTHFQKSFHSSPHLKFSLPATESVNESDEEDEAVMNDFLSRFVHKMRRKLNEAFPQTDKPTIDAMLLVIVDKLVDQIEKGASLEKMVTADEGLSEDLWRTVWEVSNEVYSDIEREKKKEKMKKFMQSEQVKALTRFASEVGVRGDMLHELRFKWAKEAMEEAEFYEGLNKYREDDEDEEEAEAKTAGEVAVEGGEEGGGVSSGLPKRHGKIKYKIYGLDLSGKEWEEVADKIHESEEVVFPQEAKPINGKCRLVTDKILTLGSDDDYQPLLAEWAEMLNPGRVDWDCLLQKLKEKDGSLYLKVAEYVLDEHSYQADIGDYSKLIRAHVTESRLGDVERILKKMSERDMSPDILTLATMVRLYCKAGDLTRAKEAFESLKTTRFKPDADIYGCMITAHVDAGDPKAGEGLLREMEARGIKPSEEIHMALLRAFAQRGDVSGAHRMVTTMQFAGYEQSPECYILLMEACAKSNDSVGARKHFDSMIRLGQKPDDRSTAIMISAYEKKNELDKGLHLLLQLEKEGFEPGIETYTALVSWLGQLELVDEVEEIVGKIAQLGEAPPLKVQVGLCDMYARAGMEKKALQALSVLEAKKEVLAQADFERVIKGLLKGGFKQEAERIRELMKSQGFTPSDSLNINLLSAQTLGLGGSWRPGHR